MMIIDIDFFQKTQSLKGYLKLLTVKLIGLKLTPTMSQQEIQLWLACSNKIWKVVCFLNFNNPSRAYCLSTFL